MHRAGRGVDEPVASAQCKQLFYFSTKFNQSQGILRVGNFEVRLSSCKNDCDLVQSVYVFLSIAAEECFENHILGGMVNLAVRTVLSLIASGLSGFGLNNRFYRIFLTMSSRFSIII
jgi:hypothetical protein